MSTVRLGWREADMLMDALISLGGDWEDADEGHEPSLEDMRRKARLLQKLRPIVAQQKGSRT